MKVLKIQSYYVYGQTKVSVSFLFATHKTNFVQFYGAVFDVVHAMLKQKLPSSMTIIMLR